MSRPHRAATYALAGALHGAAVWGAYAVLEQALFVASPLARGRLVMPAPSYWQAIGALAAVYLALGSVMGALCGLALASRDRRSRAEGTPLLAIRFRRAAVVTLAVASALHWSFVRPFGAVEALCATVSVALAAALVLGETRASWSARFAFLANPWVAGVLMFGTGWVGRRAFENYPASWRLAGAVGTLLVCGCAGAVALRLWERRRLPADSFLPLRAAAVVGVAGAVVLGGAPSFSRWTLAPLHADRAGERAGRPNVVLLVLDTVRADHLSLYGYERDTSPFLRELARTATVYERAVATSNSTLTTHASMFTGMYGSWHGAYFAPPGDAAGRPLGDRPVTLAAVLSANGYRTAAVVANSAYLGRGFRVTRGFERSYVLAPLLATSPFLLRSHLAGALELIFSSDEISETTASADEVNRAVEALLARGGRDRGPFFLFVNYMDAHAPYVPPAPFDTRFGGEDRPVRIGDLLSLQAELMRRGATFSPRERRYFVSQYDAAIGYLDSRVAALVGRLRKLGLYDDTLLVVVADHGESFGEHGCTGHGSSPYQDQVGVPLIVKYPDQSEPRTVRAPVSQVDVMPTVLRAVGLQSPAQVQGRPLQDAGSDPSRILMTESFPNVYYGARAMRMGRGVLAGDKKLIEYEDGGREMFDLAHDPGETTNLYRPDDAECLTLHAYLEGLLKARPVAHESVGQPDEVTLRNLRSLGYLP